MLFVEFGQNCFSNNNQHCSTTIVIEYWNRPDAEVSEKKQQEVFKKLNTSNIV